MPPRNIKIGDVINNIVILSPYIGITKDKKSLHKCLCICGKEFIAIGNNLKTKNTLSCGCKAKNNAKKHGKTGRPEYYSWGHMMQRCYNKKSKDYKRWGGEE